MSIENQGRANDTDVDSTDHDYDGNDTSSYGDSQSLLEMTSDDVPSSTLPPTVPDTISIVIEIPTRFADTALEPQIKITAMRMNRHSPIERSAPRDELPTKPEKRKWNDEGNNQLGQQNKKHQGNSRVEATTAAGASAYQGDKPWCDNCERHHDNQCNFCRNCNRRSHHTRVCRTTLKAQPTTTTKASGYLGKKPKCNQCNRHHTGECDRCENCNRLGHPTYFCKNKPAYQDK